MLNPAYLKEARLAAGVKEINKDEEQPTPTVSKLHRAFAPEDKINPKLKQCYEARTQIKPFYSEGKIAVLDDQTFVCKYGPSVKIINRNSSLVKTEDDDVKIEDDVEAKEEVGKIKSSFSFVREIEVDLDDIIGFDACPVSKVVITSHKSNLLRVWCQSTGEALKTIKSLHVMPIGTVEIHKSKAFKDSGIGSQHGDAYSKIRGLQTQEIENARSQLCWITISGAAVKLWQTGGNQMSKLIRVENITSLGFARWADDPAENKFYVAERNISIMGINPETKQLAVLGTLEGHYSQVTGIIFNSDGTMISGGRDKVVIVWDAKNDYKKLRTIPFASSIEGIYLGGTKDLFVAVNPSDIYHYDLKKNSCSKDPVLKLNDTETITAFYSPVLIDQLELKSFLITTHTGSIYEIVKSKLEISSSATISIFHQYVGDLDEILCAALWVDEKVAVASNTNVIKVYDLKTGSCDFLRGHTDIVLSLSCQKDWLVSSAKDNQIIFWSSTSVIPQVQLSGHLASVTSVCFSPVDFIVFSVSEDHFLKVWDKKRLLRGVVAHDKEINSVDCSPNGSLVVTGSRDRTAKIWDSESLQLVATFKGHKKGVWDAKFSFWDQLVATASADTTIKIWSLSTYDCVQTLQGHLSSVLQLQFINFGLQIVSSSSDGSMKSWELKTSTCLLTEECGDDKIWAINASRDGDVIVTGSADSILTVWYDITQEKAAQVVEKKKRLIEEEQQLNNLIHSKKWKQAFEIALNLDRPYTLLKVVREVSDVQEFRPIIKQLEQDQLAQLLSYITQWNTNTKTSTEAQTLLNLILLNIPNRVLERQIKPMQILPYTEKHLERIRKMQRQMVMLDFIANHD